MKKKISPLVEVAPEERKIGERCSVALGSALLPPANKRRRLPQVCGHCQYFNYSGDGLARCIRPDGPVWDSGDGYEWMTTCDRFKQYRDKPNTSIARSEANEKT